MLVPFPRRARRAARVPAAIALLVLSASLLAGALAPEAWGRRPPPVSLLILLLGG